GSSHSFPTRRSSDLGWLRSVRRVCEIRRPPPACPAAADPCCPAGATAPPARAAAEAACRHGSEPQPEAGHDGDPFPGSGPEDGADRKSTRLNSSHLV